MHVRGTAADPFCRVTNTKLCATIPVYCLLGETLLDTSRLPLSPGMKAGDFVFVSGQLGFDSTGKLVGDDIGAQTRQAMVNVQQVLASHGVAFADVVKVSIWLTEKSDFAAFNSVYSSFFEPGSFPARSTVVSELLIDGARVEIDVVAYTGGAAV